MGLIEKLPENMQGRYGIRSDKKRFGGIIRNEDGKDLLNNLKKKLFLFFLQPRQIVFECRNHTRHFWLRGNYIWIKPRGSYRFEGVIPKGSYHCSILFVIRAILNKASYA